jgi:predicted metalloendopeptidase
MEETAGAAGSALCLNERTWDTKDAKANLLLAYKHSMAPLLEQSNMESEISFFEKPTIEIIHRGNKTANKRPDVSEALTICVSAAKNGESPHS